jgi:lipoyl(octanoyl) transferase
VDAGRVDYAAGLRLQHAARDRVIAARGAPEQRGAGVVLLLEHVPPVVTISRRPGARRNLLAAPEALARFGVEVAETDRGGDITYHGPGQLVAYPILDLNRLGLSLHAYMRWLERVVIDVCDGFGVRAHRDECATGVWVGGEAPADGGAGAAGGAKVCAIGVRISRWVSTHGLALNVAPEMAHFGLIVPCGLAGRAVTSLKELLGVRCPAMQEVKRAVGGRFVEAVRERADLQRRRG